MSGEIDQQSKPWRVYEVLLSPTEDTGEMVFYELWGQSGWYSLDTSKGYQVLRLMGSYVSKDEAEAAANRFYDELEDQGQAGPPEG